VHDESGVETNTLAYSLLLLLVLPVMVYLIQAPPALMIALASSPLPVLPLFAL
jgi:hypothetical protein